MRLFKREKPIKMLAGTDWWTDCDDAVALRILCRAHKLGMIDLLGIGINACSELSAPSLDAFVLSEGLRDLPLGIDLNATGYGGKPSYQKRLKENHSLSVRLRENNELPDAVRLYRKILANSGDKIDLIEIGYPQVLADLILSRPDDISSLSGKSLIEQKVGRLWMMAGKWDKQGERENNFARTALSRRAGSVVCEGFPNEIVFLGWETAYNILSGSRLNKEDILYKILEDHGSKDGRSSWDPMLVLLAVINDAEKAGYKLVRGTASVDMNTGENFFTPSKNGRHAYVLKALPDEVYKQEIDSIIT